jgi:hypothetical protein
MHGLSEIHSINKLADARARHAKAEHAASLARPDEADALNAAEAQAAQEVEAENKRAVQPGVRDGSTVSC